ncbi:uncharacterized protein TNCV_3132481 [Trichonephila clavipes]|nr:uncharacterized protein TNCV_3132481 [Trichonephila clavipes]
MKLEIVIFYNTGGVDITDEMGSTCNVSRICNSWSLRIFYHLRNPAGINASTVYHSVLPEKKMRRSRLLQEIRMDLMPTQWDMRLELSNLNKTLKRSLTDTEDINTPKKGRCTVCPWVKDVKVTCFCLQCKKNICA